MIRKLHILLAGAYLYNPVRLLAAAPSTTEQNLCTGAGVSCSDAAGNAINPGTNLQTRVAQISETLLTVAGAIAVIIIIVGGLTYITSSGDSGRIKQAKDIILYAVIGLVVAIMAYAIVHFVATNFQ
jgi:type IV secretory pathway VirB2 component (pilin)